MTVALKGTDFAKSFEVTVKFADKTALNEVIAEAGKLAEPDCKSGSDEFEAAFDAAKKVAADEDATPAQVADALAALQAARKALVKVLMARSPARRSRRSSRARTARWMPPSRAA